MLLSRNLIPALSILALFLGAPGANANPETERPGHHAPACAYDASTGTLMETFGFVGATCIVLGAGECDEIVAVRVVLLGGNSDCMSGNNGCLSGGFVSIMIIGNYNSVCSGRGSVCSGNVVITVVIIGDHNDVCTSSGGVNCSGNIAAQFVVIGNSNTHCKTSTIEILGGT